MSAVPQPVQYPQSATGYGSRGQLMHPGDRPRTMTLATPPAGRSALPVRPTSGRLRPVAAPPHSAPKVRRLPTAKPVPGWLRAMAIAQGVIVPLACVMVGATAAVYGWTVYTQQRWSNSYERLEELRQREQQLLAADEVFKNELAQQAMSDDNALVTSGVNSALFMDAPPPVAPRPATPPEAIAPALPPQNRPLAY